MNDEKLENDCHEIAIVVVTYNRKNLLIENLEAILNQEYRNFDIFIIDNASTDGTKENIKKYLIKENIKYFNTGTNLGGAGGFNFGIRKVIEEGNYKYCWIMDDDTIPTSDALKSLVYKANLLENNFSFLCSIVKWTDDTLCQMNIPTINTNWLNEYCLVNDNLIQVESCSFVSCFINLKYIYEIGLPIKEFFIYGDDVEYTLRLAKENKAYIDIDSIVIHKMSSNMPTDVNVVEKDRISRAYYTYRNQFFIAKKQSVKSIVKYICRYFIMILKIILKSPNYKLKRIFYMTKGMIVGIFFNPKIEYVSDNKEENISNDI